MYVYLCVSTHNNSCHCLYVNTFKVNISGGAIALGHPVRSSKARARILVTLLYSMKRKDAKKAIASFCIGLVEEWILQYAWNKYKLFSKMVL